MAKDKPPQSVHVGDHNKNVVIGDGNTVNFGPQTAHDPSKVPTVALGLGVTIQPGRGHVHGLVITFQNRSDRPVFIENIGLILNDDKFFFVARDAFTGDHQQKRRIEPGDSFAFRIDAEDIKQFGRPPEDYECAAVMDAVTGFYRSDKHLLQSCITELLK